MKANKIRYVTLEPNRHYQYLVETVMYDPHRVGICTKSGLDILNPNPKS